MFENEENSKPKKFHKAKANGFLMFMLEFRRNNDVELNEAQMQAGQLWQKMGPEERAPYNNCSGKPHSNFTKKYTSFGQDFNEVDKLKENEQKRIMEMELTIEQTLRTAFETGTMQDLTFHFFSVSCFGQSLRGEIFPAEMAMAKFSLKDGVYDTTHMMINPGSLPVGMAGDALLHSEKTHRRPLPPNIDGESDYNEIFQRIVGFLGTDYKDKKSVPPIYIQPGLKDEDLMAASRTIEKILDQINEDRNLFRIYPIDHLLFRLHKKCIMRQNLANNTVEKPFTSVLIAKDQMSRDTYQYSDIGCEYHRIKDFSHECCLSKVQRWGYTISKLCLNEEIDAIIDGQHAPKKSVPTQDDDGLSSTDNSKWASDIQKSMEDLCIGNFVSLHNKNSEQSLPSSASRTVGSNSQASIPSADTCVDVQSEQSLEITEDGKDLEETSEDSEAVSVRTGQSLSDIIRANNPCRLRSHKRGTSRR